MAGCERLHAIYLPIEKRSRRKALFVAAASICLWSCRSVDGFSYSIRKTSVVKKRTRGNSSFSLASIRTETASSDEIIQPMDFLSSSASERREIRRRVITLLQDQNFASARQLILGMMEFLNDETSLSEEDLEDMSLAVDQSLLTFYESAFSPPFRGKGSTIRVRHGVDLLNRQLSHTTLFHPHNQVTRSVLINALNAITAANEIAPIPSKSGHALCNADVAYRILQRLITGVGVRNLAPGSSARLKEKDFSQVLNAYTNIGRMDMAHRVVALQERTPSAPVLSPVAYSILLKGYGKLGDLYNIKMLLDHANTNGIEADTIMLNSLVDAYINAGDFEQPRYIFDFMNNPNRKNPFCQEYQTLFNPQECPAPNKRTFNIMLKGFARRGMLKEAESLAEEMKEKKLWDHVTTNTLVQAAVKAHNFEVAEEILEKNTGKKKKARKSHPNAEAYTALVDGLAKQGDMSRALDLVRQMKDKGIDPNEFTYTCVIGAMATEKKVEQARKMLAYMRSEGFKPGVVTYNAFISGLLHRNSLINDPFYDQYVDHAISLLREMMKAGVRPNAVTVAVLVGGLGKCDQPRVSEAIALVEKLESEQIIPRGIPRISTAVVQVLGVSGQFDKALDHFRRLKKPDVAAVNSMLDVCTRCGKYQVAMELFSEFFQGPMAKCSPDVISYTAAISSAFQLISDEGSKEPRNLYEEMKFQRRIMPDNAVVDIILKSMIEYGKTGFLIASDVRFLAGVLRDAEKLEWAPGQLDSRKRAVRTIMTGRIAGTWEEESGLYGLSDTHEDEGELFKKHGWNKVDSGFSLWGSKAKSTFGRKQDKDDFLRSKGWNNVDSGFRII